MLQPPSGDGQLTSKWVTKVTAASEVTQLHNMLGLVLKPELYPLLVDSPLPVPHHDNTQNQRDAPHPTLKSHLQESQTCHLEMFCSTVLWRKSGGGRKAQPFQGGRPGGINFWGGRMCSGEKKKESRASNRDASQHKQVCR